MIYGRVYLIHCTVTGKQYVGQTTQLLSVRWRRHVSAAQSLCTKDTPIKRAIRKYGFDKFSIVELCTAESKDALNQLEVEHGLRLCTLAPNGYNVSLGGAYGLKHDADFLRRRGAAISKATSTLTQRRKRSEQTKRMWKDPAHAEKVHAGQQAAFATPEYQARRSAASRAVWAKDHDARIAAIKRAHATAETKLRLQAASQKLHADPQYKANVSAGLRRAWLERRESILAKRAATHAESKRRKLEAEKADPDYERKQQEKLDKKRAYQLAWYHAHKKVSA